jgi:uncharacterized FlaG/YvyC family protein
VGETAAATAREIELTRRRMEDKLGKLTERAPEEARKIGKRVAFGVISALAVLVVRKVVEKLWERVVHELPPPKAKKLAMEARRNQAAS